MSWVGLALGLIRDVAVSHAGQEILKDIRGNAPKMAPVEPPKTDEDLARWRRAVDERFAVNERNMGMLVEMLNAQEANLVRIQKRQRIWNLALAAGVLVAIAVPIVWLIVLGR
jgi:hypothetical protein